MDTEKGKCSLIEEHLAGLGMSTAFKGYDEVVKLTAQAIDNPAILHPFNLTLEKVAKELNTTASNLDKNLTVVIADARAFKFDIEEQQLQYYGMHTHNYTPSSRQFIAQLSKYLKWYIDASNPYIS